MRGTGNIKNATGSITLYYDGKVIDSKPTFGAYNILQIKTAWRLRYGRKYDACNIEEKTFSSNRNRKKSLSLPHDSVTTK